MRNMKAVVTGASSGIGKAIYDGLKAQGWTVIGISRGGPDIKADLTSESYNFPHFAIDLLVNCAGMMLLEEEGYERDIMEINFWAVKRMVDHYMFHPNGCVINIASISAIKSDEDMPIYAASKAAVIAYSKCLAKKYAPSIRFNCISPGFYDSNLVPGETPQHLIDAVPMGYEEDPTTLTPLILAIYESRFMTGSNIVIDGGESL